MDTVYASERRIKDKNHMWYKNQGQIYTEKNLTIINKLRKLLWTVKKIHLTQLRLEKLVKIHCKQMSFQQSLKSTPNKLTTLFVSTQQIFNL